MDYDAAATNYTAGRLIDESGLAAWRDALAPFLSSIQQPIVDVGSGAGQFAPLLASWFAADVVGVEPSAGMRAEAEERARHPRVRYLEGSASAIPAPDSSMSAAWLSTVVHHIPDLRAAGDELRRVVVPGGPLLIRSCFPGRWSRVTLFEFFPEAGRVVDTFPTVAALADAFAPTGFELVHTESVPQRSMPSLAGMRSRVVIRADTTLQAISDADFAQGLERLDRAIASGRGDEPVVDYLDLVVFR